MKSLTIAQSLTFLPYLKQGVAPTGRNTTGPPRAAPGELRCTVKCYRRQTTIDASEATVTIVWPPTLCVGGPVIIEHVVKSRIIDHLTSNKLLNT